MIDLFNELPFFIGLPIFMILVAVLAAIIYLVSNNLVRNHIKKEHERVGRILFRTSASLLALILSLTFANQRVEYFKIKNGLEIEAAKLVDVYRDLDLYETTEAESLIDELKLYIKITVENGWTSIEKDAFSSKEVLQFMKIYKRIHSLQAENEMQVRLRNNMLSDIDDISDYMQIRLYTALEEPRELLYTSIFGILVVMVLFSVYTPDKLNIFFVTMYNLFLGLVLYFIIMMGNPLKGPLQIKAKPFQLLAETIIKNEARN